MKMNLLRLNLNSIRKLFLKAIACGLGYTLWMSLSEFSMITIVKKVPVLLMETGKDTSYQLSHEDVLITMQGYRSAFKWCDMEQLAIHIDPVHLKSGIHPIPITDQHLFLPPTTHVVRSEPTFITITVQKKA